MNKAVLISIRPEWCEKIRDGKKTIEVRKSKPALEVPFKCYIYCAIGDRSSAGDDYWVHPSDPELAKVQGNGRVIGEFVCDGIYAVLAHPAVFAGKPLFFRKAIEDACLTDAEVELYSGGKDVLGWHISELVLYDRPLWLSDFRKPCVNDLRCESCGMWSEFIGKCGNAGRVIRKAPQSWRYVEELPGGDGNG